MNNKLINLSTKDSRCNISDRQIDKAVSVLNAVLNKEKQYENVLGWFDTDKWANDELLDQYIELSNRIRDNADCFVVIGVGGSNQASRAVIEALEDKINGPDILWIGNNISRS